MRTREIDKLINSAQEYIINNSKNKDLIDLFSNLTIADTIDKKGLCIEFKAKGMIFLRFYYDEGNGPDDVRSKLIAFILAQGLIYLVNEESGKRYKASGQKKKDDDEKMKDEMLSQSKLLPKKKGPIT